LKNASRIVSINRRILDRLKDKYGYWPGEKEIVLSNGFDPADFINLKPFTQRFFTVTYTGTQNGRMHAGVFLEAVKQLTKEHTDFSKNIRINFIGRMGTDVLEILNKAGLSGNIQLMGHLPHHECLRYTLGADLLLLLIPESSGSDVIMTGKLFEYLRSGIPILCLSNRGEAAEIIERARAGFTVPGNEIESIKKIVWNCYFNWKKGKKLLPHHPKKEEIDKYNRFEITRQLSRVLKSTVNPSSASVN
jgi:glycosyltransferase involved in cell wall biosynthesis